MDETGAMAYSDYQRHGAQQVKSVRRLLKQLLSQLPDIRCCLALTGSGAKELADRLHLPYVQEVVANSIAIRRLYHEVRTAIELGGQDAKIIFFRQSEGENELQVSDMRMNGSCAGGTGGIP